jgi:hypothetical protein
VVIARQRIQNMILQGVAMAAASVPSCEPLLVEKGNEIEIRALDVRFERRGLGGGGLSAVDIDDSAEQISQPPAELG